MNDKKDQIAQNIEQLSKSAKKLKFVNGSKQPPSYQNIKNTIHDLVDNVAYINLEECIKEYCASIDEQNEIHKDLMLSSIGMHFWGKVMNELPTMNNEDFENWLNESIEYALKNNKMNVVNDNKNNIYIKKTKSKKRRKCK